MRACIFKSATLRKKRGFDEQWRIDHNVDRVNGCFELGLGAAEVISPEIPFAWLVSFDAPRVLWTPLGFTSSSMIIQCLVVVPMCNIILLWFLMFLP